MTWGEILSYVAIGNPISQAVIATGSIMLKGAGLQSKQIDRSVVLPPPKPVTMWDLTSKNYNFVRLAGLSGTTAIIMGVYGKYSLANIENIQEQMEAKAVFETAHRYHFLHSFALLATPLVRRPVLTGSLLAVGCLLFCGPMYYKALTGDKKFKQVSTLGGFCLIAAWFSLVF